MGVRGLRYRPAKTAPWVLDGIDLDLRAGECTCVTGASGVGKTMLLRAIAGLLRGGEGEGVIERVVSDPRGGLDVGLVLQNPETQLLCTTVGDEIRLGLEHAGFDADTVRARATVSLDAVGLRSFEERNVEALSVGQKQRVAIAALLALEPPTLLLDEPTAQLDAAGRRALVGVLAQLKAHGHTLLVAEHAPGALAGLVDRTLQLENGTLAPFSVPGPTRPLWPASQMDDTRVLELENVTVPRPDGAPLLRHTDLRLNAGERVHVYGENGAGKTTLLRACAGLVSPTNGRVRVCGAEMPPPERLAGRVSFLMQNPERQFFEDSVSAEVGFVLRRTGWRREALTARVAETLADCDAVELAERSPLSLSYGEQHRVALASALAPRPPLLLLDEPFAGLDLQRRRTLLTTLCETAHNHGTAILLASHDPLPWPDWATRRLALEGGRLVAA